MISLLRPRWLKPSIAAVALAAAMLTCSACASVESEPYTATEQRHSEGDRFERMNRAVFRFNLAFDRNLMQPVATFYSSETHDSRALEVVQNRVSNFFDHLRGPIDIANNFLQGKFKRGFSGVGRLIVNSTVGLAGLFDPAQRWGMPRYPEDFGQTLAVWGVPAGPYVMLPFIGPSNVRDVFGLAGDWQIHPIIQHDDTSQRNMLIVLHEIDDRTRWPYAFERALETSLDKYTTTRNFFEQNREYEIFDGNPPFVWEDYELPELPVYDLGATDSAKE